MQEAFYPTGHKEPTRHIICSGCGFKILTSEEMIKVYITGDIIHKECWYDYAEDNIRELTQEYRED